MDDRTLLELAAKAAGYQIEYWVQDGNGVEVAFLKDGGRFQPLHENQLTDCDGGALRLAVRLHITLSLASVETFREIYAQPPRLQPIFEQIGEDDMASARRAIVRAAAEIGKAKGE